MTAPMVEIDVEVEARTAKAVLVHTGIKEEAAWLSLSQIKLRPSGIGGIYTLTVPERVAIDKGLV